MEDTNNLNFSQMLQGRIISNTQNFSLSRIEMEYLKDIFEKDPKISTKFKNVSDIEIIDRNFFYDLYSFKNDDKKYVIKIGDEDDIYLLKRETKFLKKLDGKHLAPKFYLSGFGEDYSYMITSYEHGLPLKEYGSSFFFSSVELVGTHLRKLHDETVSDYSEKKIFLDMHFNMCNFEEILDKEVFDEMKEVKHFTNCLSMIKIIKQAIDVQVPSMFESNVVLCHSNLKLSNILYRQNMIKFVNFHQSFYMNPCWDLAMASLNLELHKYPLIERRFLESYNKELFEEINQSLPAYKDVCFKIILLNIIATYFYKLAITKEDSTFYALFSQYEVIRPLIHNEFPTFLVTLDAMFGDFNNL